VVEAVEEPELDFVAELRTMANDLYQSGWEPDGKTTADIKAAIKGGDQEKAALLIKRLKDVGEVALKLDDAKAEEK